MRKRSPGKKNKKKKKKYMKKKKKKNWKNTEKKKKTKKKKKKKVQERKTEMLPECQTGGLTYGPIDRGLVDGRLKNRRANALIAISSIKKPEKTARYVYLKI